MGKVINHEIHETHERDLFNPAWGFVYFVCFVVRKRLYSDALRAATLSVFSHGNALRPKWP